MNITEKSKLPQGSFTVMKSGNPGNITVSELFSEKKVILVSVPGAFTPTCNQEHLPGYMTSIEKFKSKGIDTIAFVSVNDIFVMEAWGKANNVEDKILLLADGNGTYTSTLGLELDASGFGMGARAQRFALVANNMVIESLFVEPDPGLSISSAENVLSSL